MPRYIQQNALYDAASTGRSIADTLAQSLIRLPMLKMQLAQDQADRQASAKFSQDELAQREQDRADNLGFHRDEMKQRNDQFTATQTQKATDAKNLADFHAMEEKRRNATSLQNYFDTREKLRIEQQNADTAAAREQTLANRPAAGPKPDPFMMEQYRGNLNQIGALRRQLMTIPAGDVKQAGLRRSLADDILSLTRKNNAISSTYNLNPSTPPGVVNGFPAVQNVAPAASPGNSMMGIPVGPPSSAATYPAQGGYKIGGKYAGGIIYLGGDPKDESSWQKARQ